MPIKSQSRLLYEKMESMTQLYIKMVEEFETIRRLNEHLQKFFERMKTEVIQNIQIDTDFRKEADRTS